MGIISYHKLVRAKNDITQITKMKLILILACLVLYVAHSQAQESCRGRPRSK